MTRKEMLSKSRELFIIDRSKEEQEFTAWQADTLKLPENYRKYVPAELLEKSFRELRPELYKEFPVQEVSDAEAEHLNSLLQEFSNFVKEMEDRDTELYMEYMRLREER